MRSSRLQTLLLAVALLAWSPLQVRAQPSADDDEDAPLAWGSLRVEPGRPCTLEIASRTDDPDLAAALERLPGRAVDAREYSGWTRRSVELPAPSRHGLVLRQDLQLGPLLDALRAREASGLVIVIQHPPTGFVRVEGATTYRARRGTTWVTVSTQGPSRPVSLALGWRFADVARAVVLLLVGLLLPIAAGLVIQRRSAARDHDPEKWFLRAQAVQLVAVGGWILWMAVVDATRIADITAFALPSRGSQAMASPLWMFGFLPSALVLNLITRRIVRRLRGFDPIPRLGLVGSVRALGSLALLLVAVGGFTSEHFRVGVVALLACIATGVLLPGARGPLGTTLQALSSGALRDRLFDLAHRAGVKLRELYVVSLRRQRMANAFAAQGGVVMVADELLDKMSRREVDAVMAHEISHLEHQHPMKMLLAALLVYALIIGTFLWLVIPYGYAAALVAAWLTFRLVSRHFELAADAGAVALTGDAEALISGLGRLAHLNQMPLAWGRGWAWLITHPTTEARGMAIGRRAGLSPERVRELLSQGLPAEQRYADRERPGEQGRVFSTAWKSATLGRLGLATLAVAVATTALLLALPRMLGVSLPHVVAIPAGAVFALLVMLFLHDQLAARVVGGLESRLRASLAAGSDRPQRETGRFVALSPGDRPRIYEGFLDWDLGLLTIEPDALHYQGEQASLRVPRSVVSAIEMGAVARTWLPAPRVIIRWVGPTGEATIALRAADCRTVSAIAPSSRALASLLETWRQGTDRVAGEAVSPPGIGPVTARTPAQASAPRDLPLLLVLLGSLSAAASFALGSDFWAGLDVFAAAFLGVIAMRWPMMTSREPSPSKSDTHEPARRAA